MSDKGSTQTTAGTVPGKVEELFQLDDALHRLELEVAPGMRERVQGGPLGQEVRKVLVDVVTRAVQIVPRDRYQRKLGQELRLEFVSPTSCTSVRD